MRICRFTHGEDDRARIGLVSDNATVLDLTPAGVARMLPLLEDGDPVYLLSHLPVERLPRLAMSEVRLCAPVEQQEVWAAGVTYLRSKTARMEESDFSATAYERVYAAQRPELFFKSQAAKVVPDGETIGIRRDAKWNVPEPELALVINSRRELVGFTIGNDMSSRDIEGENLLYLPQAKIYDRSCALGPCILLGTSENAAREWSIRLEIRRGGQIVFEGQTTVGQIKRSFDELATFLFSSQTFPYGAVLLTGTGIVPADSFTLQANDIVEIAIPAIGRIRNSVIVV